MTKAIKTHYKSHRSWNEIAICGSSSRLFTEGKTEATCKNCLKIRQSTEKALKIVGSKRERLDESQNKKEKTDTRRATCRDDQRASSC